MPGFYTYLHRRKSDGLVFYVGKGKGDRFKQTGARRGAHWNRVVKKHGFIPEVAAYWPSEEVAFQEEIRLIAEFRARGAPLVNGTAGGEGVRLSPEKIEARRQSLLRAYQDPQLLQKLSAAIKVRYADPEYKAAFDVRAKATARRPGVLERKQAAMAQVRNDPEIAKRRRAAIVAASREPANREKKRAAAIAAGNRPPVSFGADHPNARAILCIETGEVHPTAAAAEQWLVAQGKGSLGGARSFIGAVCKGKHPAAYGFSWRYAWPSSI